MSVDPNHPSNAWLGWLGPNARRKLLPRMLVACAAVATQAVDAQQAAEPSAEDRETASIAVAENLQDANLLRSLLEGRKLIVFGRLEGEVAYYDIPAQSGQNGIDLRRFNLGLAGVQPWWDNVSYKFQASLASGSLEWSDMYLHIEAGRFGAFTVGNQDVTQNLSADTGSLSQLFMESPLPVAAFSLSQRLGVSYDWSTERTSVHAMVFGEDLEGDQDGRGWAVRAVHSPYRSDSGIWHAGGSVVWENKDGPARLESRPESHVTDLRFLDTGNYPDVEQRRAYSLELAGASGPFKGQLELFRTDWDRTGGRSNRFIGAYWEGGYFLTGQRFRYRLGKFVRPKLDGARAAWELGFRLSWTDLNDGDVRGGEERNAGIAINVYPRPWARGQLNLIQVNSDVLGGDGPLLQARLQLNW